LYRFVQRIPAHNFSVLLSVLIFSAKINVAILAGIDHVIDMFTGGDMENVSLCIFRYLTVYYIIKSFSIPSDLSQDTAVPYGTRLVLPHVPTILDYLNKSIKRTTKDLSKAKGKLAKISPVSNVELSVLSKISPHITDPEQSLQLVRLMLPILNATRKEESQVGMLKSIKNLLQNVVDPMVFYGQFSKLFASLQSREARTELCEVFSSIAMHDESLSEYAQLLHGLNSWDKKQLDEPDFARR
jgi:uncharacterized tellurite resistance protein B-like protein